MTPQTSSSLEPKVEAGGPEVLLGVSSRRRDHVRATASVCRTVWPRAIEEIHRASGQSPAGDPVIHGCGRVICLRVAVRLCQAAEHTCAAMLRGLAFIVISGRNPPDHARPDQGPIHKHKLSPHIHSFSKS